MHFSEEYLSTNAPSQIVSFAASGVILNSHQEILLLLRDDYPVWVNIGGIKEPEEDFEDTLHREVMEETGLQVEILKPGKDYFSLLPGGESPRYRQERVYLCQPISRSSNPVLGDEGVALKWFPPTQLLYNIPPRYRIRIHETLYGGYTPLLILPTMSEFAQTLKKEEIYGYELWHVHPKVQGTRY